MKNLLDLCIGVLAFYLFGYTIAFGESYDVGIADAGAHIANEQNECVVQGCRSQRSVVFLRKSATHTRSVLLLLVRPGAPFVASLLRS